MIFVAATNTILSDPSNARNASGMNTEKGRLVSTISDEYSTTCHSHFDQVRRRDGKIDRMSAISLNAVAPFVDLVSESSLSEDVGVFIGNMLGGWEFGERELTTLHVSGASRVSAFQATAWFPAAVQGEITIAHSYKGYSKTMSGGLSCGLEAFMVAYDAIILGKIDIAIVGACEALTAAFSISGILDIDSEIIAEGACFFLLSKFPLGNGVPLSLKWQHSSTALYSEIGMDDDGHWYNLLDRVPFHLAAQPLIELSKVVSNAHSLKKRKSIRFEVGNAAYGFEVNPCAS